MDKKILCFISNTNLFGFGMKGVNQQETLSSKLSNINEKDKGSSETTCDITYNFDEYSNLIPSHKKKINKNFLSPPIPPYPPSPCPLISAEASTGLG